VASPLRAALEQRSYRLLLHLNSLPRSVPFVVMAGLLIAGLVTQGVAAFLLLLLVAVIIGWLSAVSWPLVSPGGRLIRVACALLVLGYAFSQLT
jgi:ABC-type multidrug transport system permease subunit